MTSLLGNAVDWTAASVALPGHAGADWSCVLGLTVMLLGATWPLSALGGGPGKVRAAVFAGSWYEGNKEALASSIDAYVAGKNRPEVPQPEGAAQARDWAAHGRTPVAIIVPHAGHVFSGECAGQAFRLLKGQQFRRVILLGPSHTLAFRGAALPEEDAFATPLGIVPLDHAALQRLQKSDGFQVLPRAHAREHSLEIELPFLQEELAPGFELVPVVVGMLDEPTVQSVAAAVGELWDEHTLLVISSDFTHFGPNYDYVPFGDSIPEHLYKLDHGAANRILALDRHGFESYRDSTGATICGAEPIRVLLQAARGRSLTGRLVEYYRSGDQMGDFRNSVSYAAIAFFPRASEPPDSTTARLLNADEQQYLLKLSRRTLEALVSHGPLPEENPRDLPANSVLREPRGVFVTLTTGPKGDLRGCIGNIIGDKPLAAGVIENTVSSASRDPRFEPVEQEEAAHLRIEISVLTPLAAVSGPDQIVAGRDGVVLEKGGRRAVFLPQVATEQGWGVPELLRHLALKAGLRADDWKSGASFSVFQAQVFEEEKPAPGPGR